jgi:hypothetical protein
MANRKVERIQCVENLKNIDVAFAVWAGNNNNQYPMAVSSSQGGAQEYIFQAGFGLFGGPRAGHTGVTHVYCALSNELGSATTLYCPADKLLPHAGRPPTNFLQVASHEVAGTPTGIYGLSYFVCGDANSKNPRMILAGDRNIGQARWPGQPALATNFSQFSASKFYNNTTCGLSPTKSSWTRSDIHQMVGNICLVDGSVQRVDISGLDCALQNATNGNAILYPNYNFPN